MTPLLGFAVITAALPLAFAWLWRQQREPAVLWWAASYAANTARVVVAALHPLLPPELYRALHGGVLLFTVPPLLVGWCLHARTAGAGRAVPCGRGLAGRARPPAGAAR